MADDFKLNRKKTPGLTGDSDENITVSMDEITSGYSAQDEARITRMHNQSADANAPSELGSGTKTKRLPKGIKGGWPDV